MSRRTDVSLWPVTESYLVPYQTLMAKLFIKVLQFHRRCFVGS